MVDLILKMRNKVIGAGAVRIDMVLALFMYLPYLVVLENIW